MNHPTQVIDFDFNGAVDRSNSYVIGPDGTEVPFQVLSTGKIAVKTDLPAYALRSWKLFQGRAAGKFQNSVRMDIKPAYYEITNGVTGVRIARPEGANDTRLAPIQGIRLRDGRWTATGPNLILGGWDNSGSLIKPPLPAKTMTTRVVEQGPLLVTIVVTYTYDRPNLGNPPNVLIPAGPGQYQSTITLQAGQPSITILEDSDSDLQYYLNFYPEVQQNQARWRGQMATTLEYGRDAKTGGAYTWDYNGGLGDHPTDAVRDLPVSKPYYPYGQLGANSDIYGFLWMPPWNPWVRDTGWYWMLYNSAAGPAAPLIGMYAGRASTAIGTLNSGAAPYGVPSDATGQPAGGIGFQVNRYGSPTSVPTRVRTFWGIFVGTKGDDLGDPYQLQNIHRQLNLQGGINLNKIYRYSADFADPAAGYKPIYMDSQSMDMLIQRIRTDYTYYSALRIAQPEIIPLLDMWRDTSGAKAQEVAAEVLSFAQNFVDGLVNRSGVYEFQNHYWMGGVQMARRADFINELLRLNLVSGVTRQRLKAAMELFANILWDDDFVPLSGASGLSLGTANMPVQESQYRTIYTLLAPYLTSLAPRVGGMAASVSQLINSQVDGTGAHIGATGYIGAAMAPTLAAAQQLKTAGIVDPFQTEPKLPKFGQFLMDMLTPPEPRFGGVRKLVSIGDSPTQASELFGELATGVASFNPSLSARLMQAWKENGSPQNFFFGSTVTRINDQLPASPMNLRSALYPGWAAILRHGAGTPNETAAWLVGGEFYSDHRHSDRGSLHMYALGAPLALDWESQYYPEITGAFQHNDVVPETDIGAAWSADNIPVEAALLPWGRNSAQGAFESFDLSTRATTVMTSTNGSINWTRTVRTIAANPSYPVIAISDTFGGANAAAGKVFNMNFMAQGPVQSTAGTITPVLRMSLSGGAQALPSTSTPLSLSPGVNHFAFAGQWLIDWDLYQTAAETQQVLIGNFGHNWAPTPEANQFAAANGRTYEQRQHIFRLRGNSDFNVLILPYRKGTQRGGVTVTNAAGTTTINAPGEQTLINNAFYAYQSGQQTVLTTHSAAAAASFGVQISGGPAEVVLTPGKAVITAHGAPGTRTIQLPGVWLLKAPLTFLNGVFSLNYQGGDPVRIELGQ